MLTQAATVALSSHAALQAATFLNYYRNVSAAAKLPPDGPLNICMPY